MSSKRLTRKDASYQSKSAFEAALDSLAVLMTKQRLLEAKRDKKIQVIREEYEPAIMEARQTCDQIMLKAESYAIDHKDDLITKGKSASTKLAEYGFRTGQPTLKSLPKWTWSKVIAELKRRKKKRFVTTKESVNKDALKRELGSDSEKLALVGCYIDQTEIFWVEAKDQEDE